MVYLMCGLKLNEKQLQKERERNITEIVLNHFEPFSEIDCSNRADCKIISLDI